jgi:hypothetical protein
MWQSEASRDVLGIFHVDTRTNFGEELPGQKTFRLLYMLGRITDLGQPRYIRMCIEEHAFRGGSYASLTPMLAGPSRLPRLEKELVLGQCVAVDLNPSQFLIKNRGLLMEYPDN